MSKPTLLLKGSLKDEKLKEVVPIEYILQKFGENIDRSEGPNNRIFIIEASTGSGKTTIIPPEIYNKYHQRIGRNIVVTQPRVINAIQIPYNIIEFNNNLVMGENIGYQTGNIVNKPSKGILFVTIGLLLQQLSTLSDEEFIKKYSVVIIDEAHEMSISAELTLKFMKDLIHRNYKNKLCPFLFVMSATFDPDKFADYVSPKIKPEIIYVRGFTYPIQDNYLEVDTQDYVKKSVDIAVKIHQNMEDFNSNFRDILIFASGAKEIKAIISELNNIQNTSNKYLEQYPFLAVTLTGDIVKEQSEEYKNIFIQYTKKMTRRIIIGTNVAETGITIDTLKYVIDTGFYKSKEYNPNIAAEVLHYKVVSNDMRMQRRGRVGRKHPGIYYGLYTKENVKLIETKTPQNLPEMYKTDISIDLLIALYSFNDIDLLNPIPSQLYEATLEKLFYLNLIDNNRKLTPLGIIAKKFRFLSVESVKLLLSTINWDPEKKLLQDIVNMVSIIEVLRFDNKIDRSKIYRDIYKDKSLYYQIMHSCDFILMTLLFQKYQKKLSKGMEMKWLAKIGLDKKEKSFIEALKIRDETIFTLNKVGITVITNTTDFNDENIIQKIKRIIYEGYKLNIIYNGRTYKNIEVNVKIPQFSNSKYLLYKKITYFEMQRKYIPTPEILSNFDGISIDYQIYTN